jgi:hypothetical protein
MRFHISSLHLYLCCAAFTYVLYELFVEQRPHQTNHRTPHRELLKQLEAVLTCIAVLILACAMHNAMTFEFAMAVVLRWTRLIRARDEEAPCQSMPESSVLSIVSLGWRPSTRSL